MHVSAFLTEQLPELQAPSPRLPAQGDARWVRNVSLPCAVSHSCKRKGFLKVTVAPASSLQVEHQTKRGTGHRPDSTPQRPHTVQGPQHLLPLYASIEGTYPQWTDMGFVNFPTRMCRSVVHFSNVQQCLDLTSWNWEQQGIIFHSLP